MVLTNVILDWIGNPSEMGMKAPTNVLTPTHHVCFRPISAAVEHPPEWEMQKSGRHTESVLLSNIAGDPKLVD